MFGVLIYLASCTFVSAKTRFNQVKTRSEHGFVLVFMCLSIVTLTGVAGMAVDLGNWYFNADKVQKAADAAALAGAPSLPNNRPAAFAAARQTLEENGFTDSHIYDASTTPTDPVSPNSTDPYTRSAYIYVDPTNPNT